MSIDNFLNCEPFILEERSIISSYSKVLIELGVCTQEIMKNPVYPEVLGYKFDWGMLAEYRVDSMVIWHFHFEQLVDEFIKRGGGSCEMVMRCLSYFDLDYWPDGTPYWGKDDVNLFWGKIVERPNVEKGRHNIPDYVDISHGSETDALAITCFMKDEKRTRKWVGHEFIPIIMVEMIQQVELSLYR